VKGYLDPSQRRLPTELAYPPIRYNAFCKEPTDSSVGPRGSRQAPQPGGGRLGDDPAYMSNAGLPRQSPEPRRPGTEADPAATLSSSPSTSFYSAADGAEAGSYLLASTGGQAASGPWKDSSWSALILGPLS
jgi:hypothetical protein